MATTDDEHYQLFEDVQEQHSDRVVFRLRISTPEKPGVTAGAGGWATKTLCAKALQVLRRSALSARRHISRASQIPTRAIAPMVRTSAEGCFIGLVVTSHKAVTQDRLDKAHAAGAALVQTVLVGLRAHCNWTEANAGALENSAEESADAAGSRATRMLIAEQFFSALITAAETTHGSTLDVTQGSPDAEIEEPITITADPNRPDPFKESPPWRLVCRLESMVSKHVMRVRQVSDQRSIRVVITGFPTMRVDFRLLQGGGPLILEVTGRVDLAADVEPVVRLVAQLGLATQHWFDHTELLETLAQRIEFHSRALHAAGLLPRPLDQTLTA